MAGFSRKLWIQLVFEDGDRNESIPPEWIPWYESDIQSAARAAVIKMAANPHIAYALILDGSVKQGTEVVQNKKILADVGRERIPGSQVVQLKPSEQ